MAAYAISKSYGLTGYNNTVTTGCASGTQAIGDAMHVIRRGHADIMITGGVEATVVETVLAGFCNMKAISSRNDEPQKASRPFDKNRDGFVLGEGAGILVMESLSHAKARGARIYGEILGYGATADAYHLIAPKPSAVSAAHAMKLAIEDAKINPHAIDYVNTHGTGTPLGDVAETKAIKQALGDHAYKIPLNSTKSMIGHLIGAAGGVEAVVVLKSIETGWLHPTINLDEPDPECDLDYTPHTARQHTVRIAMSNSIGLGGQNATIIIGSGV
jgi:3-oxoacyl-[acyl-carrier-protein] synthase II